jgi:hypothetical protein
MASLNRDHRGEKAVAAGDRIKALLEPLETVCRYRERRGDDTASFDVTPRRADALAFSIAIAPGGINLDCVAFAIKELAVEEAAVAVSLVEAILAGRVRQVRRIKGSGAPLAVKAYVFDPEGRLLFKQRRSTAFAGLSRGGTLQRLRAAPYA